MLLMRPGAGGGRALCRPSVGWGAQVLPRRPACWTFRRLKMLVPARNTTSCTGNLESQSPGPCALPMKGVRNLSIFPWVRLASVWESTNHQAGVGDSAVFSASRPPDRRSNVGRRVANDGTPDRWSRRRLACISRTLAWACFGLACLPSLQVLRASLLGPKGVDEVDALPFRRERDPEVLGRLERNRESSTAAAQRARGVPRTAPVVVLVCLPGPVRHGSSVYVSFR